VISEGENTAEQNRVELLRLILEREQGRPVSVAEAAEVAEAMVSFYETLADGLSAEDLLEVE
jgi:hypothetical protein